MRLIIVLGMMLLCSLTLWAQSTATLSGQVTDPSGAAVAGAPVTLSNALTGFERKLSTDQEGVLPSSIVARLPGALPEYES